MARNEVFSILFLYLFHLIGLSDQGPAKCSLKDTACLTLQAQNTLKEFVEGVPELGIKSLKQLHLDPVRLQMPNFSYNWTDLVANGFENAIFDNVSIDMSLKTLRVSFHTTINLDFHYETSGIFLSTIPVSGDGKAEITLKNTQMDMLFMFDIAKDNKGKDFMDLKAYYYGFEPKDGVRFYFHNLYNGDKAKCDAVNNLVNTNWRIIMANFGGYLNRKMTDKIFDAVKIYMGSRALEDLAIY